MRTHVVAVLCVCGYIPLDILLTFCLRDRYYSTKWAVSGFSEALTEELAPFGISVTVVEPGYFRTGFLNPGAAIQSKNRIEAYENTAAGKSMSAAASLRDSKGANFHVFR